MQEWKTVEPRRQNQTDKSHIGHATTAKDGKYQTTNRYEILSDTTDSEVNEIVDYHERNNESRRMTAKHRYGKSSNVSTNNKHEQLNQKQNEPQTKGNTSQSASNTQASTVIIGDSMIKYMDSKRLLRGIKKNGQISRRTAIRAETYRGAGVDDMKHHIKPCLQRKPEKIILHVGTNDIGSKGAKELDKGIDDICEIIQKDSPTSEVAVSLLVTRARIDQNTRQR
jgi:hypothetical protein